jgi:hypothetical protein
MTAAQAASVLEQIKSSGAVAVARCELVVQFHEDLSRIETRMHDSTAAKPVAIKVAW